MSAAWLRKAARLPVRQLHLLGAGILLVAAAALWFHALRSPLASLRAVHAEQARLEAAGTDPRLLAAQLAALDAETATLSKQLGAASGGTPGEQLVGLIREISQLAVTHGVTLRAATPAPEEQAPGFRQSGVDAGATGTYKALLAWMAAIERARPDLAVARFDMRVARTPGQVDINIRIAAYRPQEGAP